MYAGANMGHPSREEGFVLCAKQTRYLIILAENVADTNNRFYLFRA